jgi:hypothetical protein
MRFAGILPPVDGSKTFRLASKRLEGRVGGELGHRAVLLWNNDLFVPAVALQSLYPAS